MPGQPAFEHTLQQNFSKATYQKMCIRYTDYYKYADCGCNIPVTSTPRMVSDLLVWHRRGLMSILQAQCADPYCTTSTTHSTHSHACTICKG